MFSVPVSLAAMVQWYNSDVANKTACSFNLRENNMSKQAASQFFGDGRAKVSDVGRDHSRASDVWYLASAIHAIVSSLVTAVVCLLWNNPEVLSLTLVLLDICELPESLY